MTDAESVDRPVGSPEEEPTGPVIRDKRRIDPQTGELRERHSEAAPGTEPADASAPASQPGATAKQAQAPADSPVQDAGSELHPDTVLASERLADLQRLQAEYVNYKKRVDRDRDKDREAGVGRVLESLLPVLDDIQLARQHGDLAGSPFEKIAEKLQTTLGKYGLTSFGEVGEPFDPQHHEALMHIQAEVPEGAETTTVVQVMQAGYRMGDRMLRPARVAVADPE